MADLDPQDASQARDGGPSFVADVEAASYRRPEPVERPGPDVGPFDAKAYGRGHDGEPLNAFGRSAAQIEFERASVNPADQIKAAERITAQQQATGLIGTAD